MARTGEAEAKTAQGTYAGQADQSYNAGQGDLTQFRGNVTKLASGQNVGADPFQNPAYLGNQARLQSDALDSATAAGDTEMREANRRTGGLNTGATQAGISGLALQKMRLADQLTAQRGSEDYTKNLAWQQFLARQPLDAARGEEGTYGTATGGEGTALHDLSSFGLASYGPWEAAIKAAGQAAAAAASAHGGKGGSGGGDE